MEDVASPAPQEADTSLPGSEQVNSLPEAKEVTPNEKWIPEPQPIREDLVRNAVNFLSHPKVRGTPMVQRFSFLQRRGLTREEIDEAFRQCPDPPISEATKPVVLPEGKLVAGSQTQAYSPSMHQAVVSPSQSAQHYISGSSSAIVPAHSGFHWSQLILGAGLIAAAGVGTGYVFQKLLVPKLREWLRGMVLDEKKATEAKIEMQGKSLKPSPLEEAVGAAAGAANAAAAAAAEVVSINREMLKLQTEERQQLRSLIKSLDVKTEELRSVLTIMSKNSHDTKGQIVSAHAEEPIGANDYKGSAKTYQRTATPADHVQMKQDIQTSKSMVQGNGVDGCQSNGMTNNHVSPSEQEPWWRCKKVEAETITSPKPVESTVSELESGSDQETGNAASWTNEFGAQSRGGRQGWMPPPAPKTVMPGAASAIRNRKPARASEVKPSIISEEKAVDAQPSFEEQQQSLLETGMPGLPPSAIGLLQNPVTMEETGASIVVAEENEMDAKALFEQPTESATAEACEITRKIPSSSMHEWADGGVAGLLEGA